MRKKKSEWSLGPFEYCQYCFGPPFKSKESRAVVAPTKEEPMPQTIGPGTQLANMLKAWGIHPKKGGGCKCKDMEVKMNRLGGACLEPKNLKMIVDHLQAEAKKRHLPFVRKVGEALVKRAVRKSQQNS